MRSPRRELGCAHVRPSQLPYARLVGVMACLAATTALVLGNSTVASADSGRSSSATLRLVVGHRHLTDHAGHVWTSDSPYVSGGHVISTDHRIAGTGSPSLYRYERVGAVRYRIPRASGTYQVTVHAADLQYARAGKRVFAIRSERRTVRRHVDIPAAVGDYHAMTMTFSVRVTDGYLNIAFPTRVGQATVGSIEVVRRRAGPARPPAPTVHPTAPSSVPVRTTPAPVSTAPATSHAPTSPTPSAPTITPEQFGAKGDGVTDDTAGLQEAFDDADGRTVVLTAGRVYAHSDLLYLRTSGLHVTGAATLLATNEARSSIWIQADDVVVDGVDIRTANTTHRWSAWEQMGVRLDGHSGITLRDITVDGSAAAGVYVGGSTHFVLDHVVVKNTRADGIHMTDGSSYGTVLSPTVRNSGDDGVAVVSYSSDGVACHDITVSSPVLLGTTDGRGLSVVGGVNVTETNIDVERSAAAGVYIAAEGSPWYSAASAHVLVTGGKIVDANTDTTIDHGAVLVLGGENGPTVSDVTVRDLAITGTRATASRDVGVITYGTAPSSVLLSSITIHGGPASAYQGNTPQSSYELRGIIQNGHALPDQG